MSKVVLASANRAKLRELGALLEGTGRELIPQSAFGITAAAETGWCFVENAIIKARHASAGAGLAAIADDSGLVVEALDGDPGVRSARYAGDGASDEDNWRKLLDEMLGVPEAERGARFECVLVYLRSPRDPTPLVCAGTWAGRILPEPRGRGGFGYDPVFYVPERGCSAAELPPELKNELSHRARAMRELAARLRPAGACPTGGVL